MTREKISRELEQRFANLLKDGKFKEYLNIEKYITE
jgi:hypothetical protein